MRILLTGATGLLGSALVPLLAEHHEVVAVRRPGTAGPQGGPAGVAWVEADLAREAPPVETPLEAIVHLAASRRHRDFLDGAGEVLEVSAGATVRLLEHGRRVGVRRLVLGSSGAVYPMADEPLTERHSVDPPSFYGDCKLAAERLAARFAPEISTVALRVFFVYGRGQHRAMFLPALAERIAAGRPVVLAGDDGIRTNPVHVRDAAAAVVAAVEGDVEGPCNLAGPETATLRTIAELVGERVGRAPVFASGEPGPSLVGDIGRMSTALRRPAVGLAEGLDDLLGIPGRRLA